jgi:putative peptidoglycan lipid II flippase
MVSKLLKLLNRDINSMNQAALVLAVFSVFSQVFGLIRDRLLASMVGPSAELDVYYASFKVPDLVYNAFASLFSVTVLIPFISKLLGKDSDEKKSEAHKFSSNIFSAYLIGMICVSIVFFVLMPLLSHVVAPGFNGNQNHTLVIFSRIMLLSPFLLGLSSLFGAFVQAEKKFLSFALAPVFYNLGILIGVVLLLPSCGMIGVVIGVVIGATLHLLIQIPPLIAIHGFPRLVRNIDWTSIKEVITVSLPRTLGISINNILFIIMASVASVLAVGSISVFQFSYNIQTTPLMIIGISYAVAAFPALSRLYHDNQLGEFKDMIYRAIKNILFFSIPISFLVIVLRAQIVRVLLGAGVFSWNDTKLVAACLALFAISMAAQSIVLVLVRGFYAKGNTKTPIKISVLSAFVTISSAILLILIANIFEPLKEVFARILRLDGATGVSVTMLALAYSIGQITNAALLWKRFKKETLGIVSEENDLSKIFWQVFTSGFASAVVAYLMLLISSKLLNQDKFIGVFLQTAISAIFGVATYAIVLFKMKNKEVIFFLETLKSKFWKERPVIQEQSDI